MAAASIAKHLSLAASNTSYETLGSDVKEHATAVFVDTFAALAAGSADPTIKGMGEHGWLGTEGSGDCTMLSNGTAVSPVAAALANGSCGNAQLLGEGFPGSGGHPAIHIVPAILAASEHLGVDGKESLAAFVVAYEVGGRIGLATGGMAPGLHSNAGRHSMAVAAAVAYMASRRSPDAIEAAIEAAAGLAILGPWEFANQAADFYHLLPGMGVAQGVISGANAAAGWSSATGLVEDFFGPRAGKSFDAGLAFQGVERGHWSEYLILTSYFKLYPACTYAHSSIDAALAMRERPAFDPQSIAELDVRIAFGDEQALVEQNPRNLFAARYSIPTLVGIALSRGRRDALEFTWETVMAPEVRALSARTNVRLDPQLRTEHPGSFAASIRATLTDGSAIDELVAVPRGSHASPPSEQELAAKHRQLLRQRFSADVSDLIPGAIATWLRGDAPIADITRLLRSEAQALVP